MVVVVAVAIATATRRGTRTRSRTGREGKEEENDDRVRTCSSSSSCSSCRGCNNTPLYSFLFRSQPLPPMEEDGEGREEGKEEENQEGCRRIVWKRCSSTILYEGGREGGKEGEVGAPRVIYDMFILEREAGQGRRVRSERGKGRDNHIHMETQGRETAKETQRGRERGREGECVNRLVEGKGSTCTCLSRTYRDNHIHMETQGRETAKENTKRKREREGRRVSK